MATEKNNQNGTYVIQEQGDLGLGTQVIDPKYLDEQGNIRIPKDESKGFEGK